MRGIFVGLLDDSALTCPVSMPDEPYQGAIKLTGI